MNILVIIPPYVLGEENKAVMPNKAMLPIGPLVVAGQLRDRGHEVKVVDLVFEEDRGKYLIENFPHSSLPDALLLSCHTVRNIPSCAAVLEHLYFFCWGEKPYTVLGGNSCLHLGTDDFRQRGLPADAVVRGFGHAQNVIEAIENRQTGDIIPADVTGDIPVPALDLLPRAVQQKYLSASGGKYPLNCSSGCHHYRQCGKTYCTADMDSPLMPRDSKLVFQELAFAYMLGYRHVWCVDNIFFANKQAVGFATRFDRILAGFDMTWSCMTRVERVCHLPKGYLQQLTALTDVAMGVETVSEDILQDLARTTKRHQILTAFRRVREAGKSATAFVMLDLPGSDDHDFFRLMEFLEGIDQQTEADDPLNVSQTFYKPGARKVAEGVHKPEEMGFFDWPLGYSNVSPIRVVQYAMVIFGRFWKRPHWTPKWRDLFWETTDEFGVNFEEGRIIQKKTARDPAGDLPEVWEEEEN